MKEIKIKVSGMMCSGCENRIKNTLNMLDGVEKVEADHNTGIVVIIANENIDKEVIEEKIDNIGFEVIKED